MAISETQKVDYLWKKLAYGLSKTDTNANKRATNESIASPLLLRGENVWAQSSLVPGVMPGSSSGVVTVYPTSSPDETTADSSATLNRTWKTGLTDWISPEYGSTYLVKVYIHTAGQPGSAASSGTQVFGAGSGNNDEWFFDYQSGILHFIGTNLPSGISGKSVYVSGARYTGIKGVAVPGAGATFTTLNVTGITTFVDNVQISSLTDNRIAIVGSGSTIEDDANLTFDGSTLAVGVDLDVDGHTELDDVNVSTALTANNLIVTGSTLLSHSNSLKLQTTGIGVSISNGVGLTATIAGPTNLIIDPGVVGDNTGIVRIKGDLFVDGEQTQINSTTIELADFIVGVATTATSDLLTDGAGIQIGPNNTFLYEFNSGTNPSLKSSENLNVASGKVYQIDQTERLSADTLSLGTGTTIHSPASNALTFGTNGTEKVRITSDGDVGIGSVIPAGKLDVVGHTELDNLNVSGIATFVGDIATNGNLDVDGRTELDITNIDETLNVVGISTFAELIIANNGLIVTGVSTFNSDVILPNQQDLILGDGLQNSGNFKLYNGANEPFEIFGSAKETYIRNTGSNANGISITANGSVTLGGGGSGSFSVHAAPDGTARLSVNTVEKLRTDPSGVIVTGILTANTFVGDGDFVELDVDGRTELDITNISETLNVVGIATFANNIDANGDLDVDGRTELDITNISETLNVTGISTFASDIDINASIDVDGRTELDTTNISETLNVTGISTFASAVDINADLDVDGRTELDITNIAETLNVVGIATFASDIDINASIDVDGRTELDTTNISETLNVTGISTFASDIDINASIDVDGHTELDDVNVSGVSTFASAVDINADLDVDGRTELDITNISETLNVTGITTFENNVNVGGALSVTGNSYFVGVVTFAAGTDGNIVLGDAATDNVVFNADVNSNIIPNTNNTYDLGSSSQEWKDLYLNGIAYIDTLEVHEGSTLNGDLDVDGHTELDNLNVSGVSTFASAVDINADLDVDGRTELDITNISETLNVTGIATFANNIDANGDLDVDGHTNLDNVSVAGVSTFSDDVNIIDGKKIQFGNSADLQIYHSGTHSYIDNNTASVYIRSNVDNDDGGNIYIQAKSGEDSIVCNDDGNVELYYNNVNTFQTNANGVKVQGPSGGAAILYLNADQGSNNIDKFRFKVGDGGPLSIENDASGDWEKNIEVTGNGAVSLYYDNSKKFETTPDGIDVTGHTETDTLRVSGLSTFTGNIDANGNLDVDGQTDLDVLNVSDTATFTSNIDANGDLDVDGRTELDITNISETLNVTGISTFASAVDINADLDVDGHTELDNVNISGVATATAFHTGVEGSAIRVTSDTISGPSEIIIDPAGVGDNTGALRIKGDLFVDGTQTVINSTAIELADFIVGVATTATTNVLADGAGIGIGTDKFFTFDNTNTAFKSTENLNLESGHTYKIAGTDVLSATTLGSSVVNSSLTNLGTLTALTVTGAIDANGDLDVDGHTELDNLKVTGVSTFSGNLNLSGNITSNVTIVSTDAGTSAAPELKLFRNSASPDDADYLGQIKFAGESDTGVERNYAKITGKISDASNGTEDGIIEFAHIKDGSQTITGRWKSTELQLLNGTNLSVNGDLDVDGQTDLDVLNVSDTATFTGNAIFDSTGSIQIPKGTTGQRLTGVLGQIRYNTQLSQFEGYGAGNAWGSLGGVKDVDGDTFITAEASAGNDDDVLSFHTAGSIRVAISSTGQVGIGSTIPAATLDVLGNTKLTGILTVTNGIDGIGIQSEGTSITTGIVTTLNFVGSAISAITNTNGLVEINLKGGTFTRSTTSFTATAGQTSFSLTYTPNFIDVYHNGVKLTASEFTATNGTSVVLSEGAFVGDTIDIVVFQNSGSFDSSKWSLVDTGNQSGDIFRDANVGIGTAIPTDAAHSSNTKILNVGIVTANTLYGALVGSVTGTITGTADLAEGLTGTPNITVGNITSHNINSTGIITATSFVGPVTGNADTASTATNLANAANITTGTISNDRLPATITKNLTGNVTGNVTGNLTGNVTATTGSFSGNVSIGGTLTYEDVTNIDSIGIVTARTDVHVGAGLSVAGISTFTGLVDINGGGRADSFKVEDLADNRVVIVGTDGELEDDANFTFDGTRLALGVGLTVSGVSTFASAVDINANLDVDGHTELDDVNVSGASTFSSAVDINADLDVDGHTNLDHVIVSLASTFSDRVIFNSNNSIQIPVGTEAQKDAVGTAVTGQIRFNTTNAQFEGFGVGNNWGSLGGVKDVDGDTFIRAESAAGEDEDELQFITGNTNRVVITSGGSVGVGSTIPAAKVDLEGVLGLESTITTISSTSVTTIDTLPIATYRSAKFQIQVTQGTSYQTADLLVIHDGLIASSIEYASISTGEELAVFTTTISGSNLLLQATMSNASSATVKVVRYGVTI